MAETGDSKKKRKRSAVACVACHSRKVRCNVSWQGIPCSNCVEDGISCDIYRRETHIPKRRAGSTIDRHPLSPSSSITQSTVAQYASPNLASRQRTFSSEGSVRYTPEGQISRGSTEAAESSVDRRLNYTPRGLQSAPISQVKQEVRPFFAGESEGLEFLFDLCCPDRPNKGVHYATPAKVYRAKRMAHNYTRPAHPLPAMAFQRELIRTFFLHVWPVLPVVDPKDFLTGFFAEEPHVSPLLLWSVFFAAASYVDQELLKYHGLPSRKALKEQFYQCAKEIYDAQEEPDKTVLIQSALLLASAWYIDLDDRDGMCHWLGIAISLCHTIGVHRKDSYDYVSPGPFSSSLRRIWKCLWWTIMFREAFTALGYGRPMRVDSEDCDVPIPKLHEVYGDELNDIPANARTYLPSRTMELATLWINLLELGLLLERVLKRHYRPRSFTISPNQLEHEETAILSCRDRLLSLRISDCPLLTLHASHLTTYYNSVLIALYRPYLHRHLGESESWINENYHDVVIKAKNAASSTTNVLNELISRNAISTGPSMLITGTMSAMQIYVWELRHSSGLSRNYAYHQLELYLMVLSHLGKTYWTADLQHNLFLEALKVLNNGSSSGDKDVVGPVLGQGPGQTMDLPSSAAGDDSQVDGGLMHGTLEDYLLSFNPFMGLPMQPDELSTSVDLDLGPTGPLIVDNLHQT